jgi:hypothetical protein
MSNVKFWLEAHGYDPSNERFARVLFDAAKTTARAFADEECHAPLMSVGA